MPNLTTKTAVHYLEPELVDPGNPIVTNVIGIGGTGTHVLSFLADINSVLIRTGHPGLLVRAYDEDVIADHNCGRQRFFNAEIGYPKAAAAIHRTNRCYGTSWRAMLYPFCLKYKQEIDQQQAPQIVISCVDTVRSRFEIQEILADMASKQADGVGRDRLHYWMDFGNARYTGQVQLGTFRKIKQPESEKFIPVGELPLFTDEYRTTLSRVNDDDEPSCSLEQSLLRQDLFIHPALAIDGTRLLYQLLTHKMIDYRGVFVNIDDVKTVKMPISVPIALQVEHQESKRA
jgi:PRTRC genetic system ThiF family protein